MVREIPMLHAPITGISRHLTFRHSSGSHCGGVCIVLIAEELGFSLHWYLLILSFTSLVLILHSSLQNLDTYPLSLTHSHIFSPPLAYLFLSKPCLFEWLVLNFNRKFIYILWLMYFVSYVRYLYKWMPSFLFVFSIQTLICSNTFFLQRPSFLH